jgi:hypothetical protein
VLRESIILVPGGFNLVDTQLYEGGLWRGGCAYTIENLRVVFSPVALDEFSVCTGHKIFTFAGLPVSACGFSQARKFRRFTSHKSKENIPA